MKTPPIKTVNERFGEKAKLVEAVQALATKDLWIDRVNGTKGLGRVSNAKLLKLHATLTEVKKDFGSRDKLVDAVLASMKREKDTGLREKLLSYSTPRLLDLEKSAKRRAKSAEPKAKAKKAPVKAAPAKKAPAKKAPAKKPAAAKKKTAKKK
jgi:hypothetical protein